MVRRSRYVLGPGGSAQLDPFDRPDASCQRIAVLRDLIEHLGAIFRGSP